MRFLRREFDMATAEQKIGLIYDLAALGDEDFEYVVEQARRERQKNKRPRHTEQWLEDMSRELDVCSFILPLLAKKYNTHYSPSLVELNRYCGPVDGGVDYKVEYSDCLEYLAKDDNWLFEGENFDERRLYLVRFIVREVADGYTGYGAEVMLDWQDDEAEDKANK